MKQKTNAREKREAETLRRKEVFSPKKTAPRESPDEKKPLPEPAIRKAERIISPKSPEEEAKEFLDYLERYGSPDDKDEAPRTAGKKSGRPGGIPRLNLEEGMPPVSEALARLTLGIQEMRHSRIKAVKLIHGYGSSGRGGKIGAAVRDELASMQRRKQIRAYIPGEKFGPMEAASRTITEQDRSLIRDPDYGRMNHGITIVIL